MDLFIGIGVTWIVGMVVAVGFGGKKRDNTKYNVRKHIVEFKKLNKELDSTIKGNKK